MNTVTIPKKEYIQLKQLSRAYKKLTSSMYESMIGTSSKEVTADFRQTGLYTEEFLEDLENGLRKSSYGKRK